MNELHFSMADLPQYFPERDRFAHKGNFGKVLILGGSVGFTGAPKLAANAALRCGSGLIYVGVPKSVYPIVASGLTEPMPFPLPSEYPMEKILPLLSRCDACLVGIGMGNNGFTQQLVFDLLRESKIPLVIDADGINVLARHIDVLRKAACPVILTPHEMEFARLGGRLDGNRVEAAAELAKNCGAIVLRKGHRTIVTDGEQYYVNQTGNPGMATGGSGDVLSGVILSLLGQGKTPFEAAAIGALLHGGAGDLCAKSIGEYGMTPSDMIQALPQILKQC